MEVKNKPLDKRTVYKARKILSSVKFVDYPRCNYHFTVLQDSGVVCDVYKSFNTGVGLWSCNAVGTRKDGTKFGCVFNTKSSSKPFCSHTLACQMWLDGEDLKTKTEVE